MVSIIRVKVFCRFTLIIAISLPSSRANRLMSFDAQDEILTSLQANPDGLGARKAISFTVEEAPIAGDHADDLID